MFLYGVHAVRDILQNWIDSQYKDNLLTSGIKNRVSKIKRVFLHNGIKYHEDDFTEPLEYKAKIKEELYEMTMQDIRRKMNLLFLVDMPNLEDLLKDTSQTDIGKSHYTHLDLFSLGWLLMFTEKVMLTK